MSSGNTGIYKPVLGLEGPIYIGDAMAEPTQQMLRITAPQLTATYDTEEMGILATGLIKAYTAGELDVGINFTVRRFKVDNADPPEIAMLRAAFMTGSAVSIRVEDTMMGTILGDFIVSEMPEPREKGKVKSWSVKLMNTYVGRKLSFSDIPAQGGEGG